MKPAPPPSQAARELPTRAALVLPYFLPLAHSVFCVTPDDPYITYRYAANLLAVPLMPLFPAPPLPDAPTRVQLPHGVSSLH